MATNVQSLKDGSGKKFYPKTVADAVAYDENTTVKAKLQNALYFEKIGAASGDTLPINADTLNGFPSSHYVSMTELNAMYQYSNIYVNGTSGSDLNNGSVSAPFKSIQSAINAIPLSARYVNIVISSGQYDGNLVIQYKHSTLINFIANTGDDVKINGYVFVTDCKTVGFTNIKFIKAANNADVEPYNPYYFSLKAHRSNISVTNCTFTNSETISGTTFGINIENGQAYIYNSTITGYDYGIHENGSYIKCLKVSGNNKYMYSAKSGIIHYDDDGTVKYTSKKTSSGNGGLIINNSVAQWLNSFNDPSTTNSAQLHNNIYRGKDITNYLTNSSLFDRISSGTFDDLFIGDYFTMNITVDGYTVETNKYVLCGFDTYYRYGDTANVNHHAVVMPAGRLFSAAMNAENITTTGYYNTVMHQTIMPKIATAIEAVVGSNHLLTYRDLLSDTAVDGKCTNSAWYDTKCRLCNEVDVFGMFLYSNGHDIGIANHQLPIFKLNPNFCLGEDRNWMWLSTVANDVAFSDCFGYGSFGNWYNASLVGGVRPRFLLG